MNGQLDRKSPSQKLIPKLLLNECWLYAVSSPADLARRLQLKEHELQRLAVDVGNYQHFVAKQDGRRGRAVQAPIRALQTVHARVHRLLSRVEMPDYMHSATLGRSYITNSSRHHASTPCVKIDIKSFFASSPRTAVFRFFVEDLKARRDVAGVAADILTCQAKLATGSSASPILSYYAFRPMFEEINALAKDRGLTMSCYIDDMTFSGSDASDAFLSEVREIIRKHGLKSHKVKRFAARQPRVITGVCLTVEGRKVPRSLHHRIGVSYREFHSAGCEVTRARALRKLLGRLDAAGQIEPEFRLRASTLRSSTRAQVPGPQVQVSVKAALSA